MSPLMARIRADGATVAAAARMVHRTASVRGGACCGRCSAHKRRHSAAFSRKCGDGERSTMAAAARHVYRARAACLHIPQQQQRQMRTLKHTKHASASSLACSPHVPALGGAGGVLMRIVNAPAPRRVRGTQRQRRVSEIGVGRRGGHVCFGAARRERNHGRATRGEGRTCGRRARLRGDHCGHAQARKRAAQDAARQVQRARRSGSALRPARARKA